MAWACESTLTPALPSAAVAAARPAGFESGATAFARPINDPSVHPSPPNAKKLFYIWGGGAARNLDGGQHRSAAAPRLYMILCLAIFKIKLCVKAGPGGECVLRAAFTDLAQKFY